MKGYKNYSEINFNKIFEEYQKNNLTQTEISKKYNIPYSTFNSRYVKWKMQMTGGNLNSNKEGKLFKKYSETESAKKQKNEKIQEMFDHMHGVNRGGNRDIVEELCDKKTIRNIDDKKNVNKKNNEQKGKNVKSIYDVLPEKYQNFD